MQETILIVEDESINRRILKGLLQHEYHVIEACNGQEGLDILLAQREHIAAVLLDVVMPVMDGYEFLEHLQEENIRNIPIIVTTGSNDDQSEQRALETGAWDFVTKPYNARVLLGRLKNAIARSQLALYKQMQKIAAHDPLTGLHNRGRMFGQCRSMIDQHPDMRFAFMRIDIDHFALFNTSFGEEEGNKLLKYMAQCLEELAQAEEYCHYCRMNSDVFCACFSYDGREEHLQTLVDDMQRKLTAYKKDYLLQLSVGVCIVTDPKLSIDELYFRASVAARKCKNQYAVHLAFYDAEAGRRITEDIAITNEMQTALKEKQFVVYLQPKFRVASETICGAEALVRWVHPTKGMISPGAFIPVFENNGFITKLDYYVWEQTCIMLRKWIREGKTPYPVSVNVSRISLYNPKLVSLIKGLVERYEISPALLQLEITESAYMTNPELMEATIRDFHEAGFTILMDDFGSGYSSLNTLKRIYIDVLKVDMKFLPIGGETERGEIILACVIKMAKLLGISVVSEGVETKQQRDFLEGAGCDSIQGYYYSRPIPQSEYEQRYLNSAYKAEKPPMRRPKAEAAHRRGVTVLAVGCSPEERELIRENLRERYHVHLSSSAESALAYLRNHKSKVRLILLDDQMPGTSGMKFLKYCRMDSMLKAIPKLLITDSDDAEKLAAAFRAGAYDYIAKPLQREVLLARVNHAMLVAEQTFSLGEMERDYQQLSERDVLTGLLNKLAFQDMAARVLQATPEDENALMVVDVDNFKQVNDGNGHLAGDSVLECAADVLRKALRKTDIIGRFGGDEFVVMMTRIPNHDVARKKAAEIIKNFTFQCARQLNIDTSMSIGIAFTIADDSEQAMFARADQALYLAKKSGKAKAMVYGEKVPPIRDDDKPVLLVCSEDPQLYPAIALSYGETAAFANIVSLEELKNAFVRYGRRICVVCLDMQKKHMPDADAFYNYLLEHGAGERIPILAFCKEGNLQQMRKALEMEVMDVMALPPNIDLLQHKLSAAVTRGRMAVQLGSPSALNEARNQE